MFVLWQELGCNNREKKMYKTSGHVRFSKLKIIFSTKLTEAAKTQRMHVVLF